MYIKYILSSKKIAMAKNIKSIAQRDEVLNIFKQNLKNKNKLIPFNITKNTVGQTKYFPPTSKE
jgi:hypothetical protein